MLRQIRYRHKALGADDGTLYVKPRPYPFKIDLLTILRCQRKRIRRAAHARLNGIANDPTISGGQLSSKDSLGTYNDEVDAWRRLVFVADLNPATVNVLMETASHNQWSAVRDALYNHIAGKAFVGVKLPVSSMMNR